MLPAELVDDVVAAKTLAGGHNSVFDQLTLAQFIARGAYDRHVRRSRLAYRRRRDRLIGALQRRVPEVRVSGIAAGLHALLELPAGQDESEVVARAARRGLAIEGLGPYNATQGHRRPALVVGYGTPPEHEFTAAIARLCAGLNEVSGPRPRGRRAQEERRRLRLAAARSAPASKTGSDGEVPAGDGLWAGSRWNRCRSAQPTPSCPRARPWPTRWRVAPSSNCAPSLPNDQAKSGYGCRSSRCQTELACCASPSPMPMTTRPRRAKT